MSNLSNCTLAKHWLMRWSDRSMRGCLPYLTNKLLANSQGRSQINHQSPITPSYEFFVTPNMLNIRFATHRYASLRFTSLCFASLSSAPLRSALLRFPLFFLGAGMSNIQLWQFSSKSSSKKSQKPRFLRFVGFPAGWRCVWNVGYRPWYSLGR